ncbi:MAG: hypothetical protein IRZ10_07640 [Thermoflavifilum sp.]|nr:hypothetical protein [Thermoflavifilum sp.]MCL6514281.1 hypothetical protein [Alicyclobacillus sp.]
MAAGEREPSRVTQESACAARERRDSVLPVRRWIPPLLAAVYLGVITAVSANHAHLAPSWAWATVLLLFPLSAITAWWSAAGGVEIRRKERDEDG